MKRMTFLHQINNLTCYLDNNLNKQRAFAQLIIRGISLYLGLSHIVFGK